MQYVCDAGSKTWFRLETGAEAERESRDMEHAVGKYFNQAHQLAVESYVPPPTMHSFEQKIGLKAHIQRAMPLFLTLRDNSGVALQRPCCRPAVEKNGRSDRSSLETPTAIPIPPTLTLSPSLDSTSG